MIGLNDKTVVLAGPFGPLLQNLVARLTEYGSDVALLTDDVKSAQRVCQNIMDMREVSEKFGRATAIATQADDEKSVSNAFGRAAELFGSTDIYVDTYLYNMKLPFFADENLGPRELRSVFHETFLSSQNMTNMAAQFLKTRSRGRILYIFHELDMLAADRAKSDIFLKFAEHLRTCALDLAPQNTSVNALALGVNEEYLLSRFGKSTTIQHALKELQKTVPHARLVDYVEIANWTAFLASPLSSGLSGQVLRLDYCI